MNGPIPSDPAYDLNELRSIIFARAYSRSEEPFQLSSGGTSHDYVDMRRGVARGDDLLLAARTVLGVVAQEHIEFDAIGGMTMGADPVAHAVALLGAKSWFSVRKAEKSHGSKRRIEGADLAPEVRVLVFEDTVTTGRSILEACDVIAESGANIVGAMTLLDRGDAAAPLFEERSIPYHALLTYRDLGIESISVVH